MLDFEEELKKFHPNKEVEDVEKIIYERDLTDVSDIVKSMLDELRYGQDNSR
ncbi:hypothetical protein SAMN05216249_1238 [Acetitomaculum ruminis DSM 5522]|uniref:Uncharacterized protein n=1 Tax=Acetitomaculum ruminis DSM 5522 TaxID=1120918 RepID=A0A1I1AD75_9FIRM|nr:hypothetical protein [Acetitomaculum ruminis]SFB34468.1 hypothetical protein SAMN05216249_1238 [Acetitomaculum ruminis DSM 5522]